MSNPTLILQATGEELCTVESYEETPGVVLNPRVFGLPEATRFRFVVEAEVAGRLWDMPNAALRFEDGRVVSLVFEHVPLDGSGGMVTGTLGSRLK